MTNNIKQLTKYEEILLSQRGYVSKWPANNTAVVIISGGLDSIIMAASLLKKGYTLFPLHIERGQTNYKAERKSIEYFTKFFKEKHPLQFKDVMYIKLNIPPQEFKAQLIPYTKQHGHPLRDTMLQMAAVQYGASLQLKIRTVFCAVMPEDFFQHSKIESIRATNVAVCQNMGDWNWLITSPNVDPYLEKQAIDKPTEILWAHENNVPVENTISCNDASEKTNYLHCGSCSSCRRRMDAFKKAGVIDKTQYFTKTKND